MKKYILLVALLIPALASSQSTQVNVMGIPPVLPSPFISDFEQNVFNGNYAVHLNIIGSGSASVEIEIRAEVFKDGQKLIDEKSLPVSFSPGLHVLSPFPEFVEFEASTYDILNSLPSNIFNQVIQSGSFPEGDYTITFTANRAGATAQTSVPGSANFMVRYPQPPVPITPANGSQVEVQVPVFSWAPAITPPGVNVEYDVLIVELFDGQNPGDAIFSNRAHASIQNLNNAVIPYTGQFLPLEQGRTYAWQIIARDSGDQFPFKNEGRSEIHQFTMGEDPDDENGLLTTVATVPEVEDFEASNLPLSTITGNVDWGFKISETADGISPPTPVETQTFPAINDPAVGEAIDDPNYVLGIDDDSTTPIYTGTTPSVVAGNATAVSTNDVETDNQPENTMVPVFGGGISTGVDVGIFNEQDIRLYETMDIVTKHAYPGAKVKAIFVERGGDSHVIATTTADEDGNFTLAFVASELQQFVIGNGTQTPEQQLDDMVAAYEDDRRRGGTGTWQQSTPAVVVPVKIVIDSPYIHFSQETQINVNPNRHNQSYEAGTLTGFAQTYRLQSDVINTETNTPIPDAKVEIFRRESWYNEKPVLRPEGAPMAEDERGETVLFENQPHNKVAEMTSGGTITRLFPRKEGVLDRYTVQISAEGYTTKTTRLSASPDLTFSNVVTVNNTYELQQQAPIVEGMVLRSDNLAFMDNVSVTLWQQGSNSPAYSTVTDSEGRFIISEIETRNQPYTLRVSGSRFSTYEEELLLNQNGIEIERDPLLVSPALITVVGSVNNDEGVPVNNATVRWAIGGNPVQTDEEGRFVTANTAGTHELEIRKFGHRDKYRTVTIELEDNWEDMSLAGDDPTWNTQKSQHYVETAGQWAESVMNTTTFQQSSTPFNPGASGYSGNIESQFGLSSTQTESIANNNNLDLQTGEFDALTVYFSGLMGEEGTPGGIEDIGAITMTRSVGRLLVSVEDETSGEPIADAAVSIGGGSGQVGSTDDEGIIFFNEAPGGTVPIRVVADSETNYVPFATEVTVTDNGDTTKVTLSMEMGGRATGEVYANDYLEGATVRVVGREDIYTTTDEDGMYTLAGIPTGEWELRASKSGYVGTSETAFFTLDESESIHFLLGDAGFEITTLLGFDIEVDEVIVLSDTTITGAFVSIPSNSLFEVENDLRLPFTEIRVYEHEGDLLPVHGEIETDVSEISAKVFNLFDVKIKNSEGLIVQSRELFSSDGFIAGTIEADLASTFSFATGWNWPQAVNTHLSISNIESLPDGIAESHLVALTNDGSFPFPDTDVNDFEFTFESASRSFDLFGFDLELDLNETSLRYDGIHTSGSLLLADIPLLDDTYLNFEKLWIAVDGSVREASFDFDPNPQLTLFNWGLKLSSGTLTEAGLLLGGGLMLALPGSDSTEITFSKLSISGAQLHGGEFSFPVEGIDIFGIASFRSNPGKDITFGKVQGESIYYVTGSAVIGLPRLIERELEIDDFLIRTDGQLSANIAANFEADFYGLADLSVSNVSFSNTSSPEIRIDGQFGLHAIPFVTAQVGGINYRQGGGVSVDEILLGFEIAGVAEAQVGIYFIDETDRSGFAGMGGLVIHSSPIDAAIEFQYIREGGGVTFGADIAAGIPPIPVGAFAIDRLGGGFTYNQALSEYRVSLTGRISVGGVGSALAIDPLAVTVSSGPVITGSADVSVIGENVANANITVDFPNALVDMEAELAFTMLDELNVNVDRRARLVVSGDEDNFYWMAGISMQANLASLFTGNANFLVAWNLNVNDHPEYYKYTNFLDESYIHDGSVQGVFMNAAVEIGISYENRLCVGFTAVEACGYFWNNTNCQLSVDLGGSQLGLSIGSNWEGGGYLEVFGYDIINADAWATGQINGGYSNGDWYADGLAKGEITGSVGICGDDVGCNSWCMFGVVPRGRNFCGGAEIDVDYNSSEGLDISLSLTETVDED